MYRVALSHPLREQLAEVVMGLPGFEVDPASRFQIRTNRDSWKPASRPSWKSRLLALLIRKTQRHLGLINLRRFQTEADLSFANGGFLLTNKPYVIYVEKSTQLFGYSGRQYGKPLARWLLKRSLGDPHLKKIFFRTIAARTGMLNIPEFDKKTRQLLKEKSLVVYPPLANPGHSNLARFHRPKQVTFLFVTSIFYEKGGRELIRAFARLRQERSDVRLQIVGKVHDLATEDQELIEQTPDLTLHAPVSREELFRDFFNRAQVFAYPTYSDSFSAVINEAIAADLPIISSDFFAIPERVIDGNTGFLFPSPFPNYDDKMVIRTEHFGPESDFPAVLYRPESQKKRQAVEQFLYEKMGLLAGDSDLLERMAHATHTLFKERLDPDAIRSTVNQAFLEAVS